MNSKKQLEVDIIPEIAKHFRTLGYDDSQIELEASAGIGSVNHVDLLISDASSKPSIVIEAKTSDKMPVSDDAVKLRFHPAVRQAQFYAEKVQAQYYVLSDGKSYLWFKTDETGRPLLLDQEIFADPSRGAPPKLSRQQLVGLFTQLRHMIFARQRLGRADERGQAAAILLLKIASERYGIPLSLGSMTSIHDLHDQVRFIEHKVGVKLPLPDWGDEVAIALDFLHQFRLSMGETQDILSAFDEVFFQPASKHEAPRLPRALVDFLVELANIDSSHRLLDLNSTFGDITSAAMLRGTGKAPAQIRAVCNNQDAILYTLIQHLVTSSHDNLWVIDSLEDMFAHSTSIQKHQDARPVSRVVFVPPIGIADYHSAYHVLGDYTSVIPITDRNNYEDVYIAAVLQSLGERDRLVVVVPESLLFAQGKRQYLRRYLLDKNKLSAVISLPPSASLSGSQTKVSILIIDGSETANNNTYFAKFEDFTPVSTFNHYDVPVLSSFG